MNLIPWRRKRAAGANDLMPATLGQLRKQIDTLFERFFRDPWSLPDVEWPWSGLLATPRTDLADSADEVTVTMELPGVDPQDVDIQITGDRLTVRGTKKAEKEEQRRDYHYVERQYGSFHRTVQLPSTVDPNKVDASYKNGVLTIRIGKRPDLRPKKIKVRQV